MDKELNELKSRFEEEIPTSFTARDKRAVMNRINEPEPERGSRHFFPKAMTAAVFAAVVLVGVMFANNQLGLTGGDGSAPVTQNSDKPTTEPEEKGELLLHITKERKNDSLTFDPETIKPGDVIGEDSPEVMKVTNVERSGNKTIITFDGTKEISGTLYNSEELQFIPNEESTQRLPVASEDLGDLVKAGLLNEDKVRMIFGIGPTFSSTDELAINIGRIEYIYTKEGSSINFEIRNAVSVEDEMDFRRETYETTIELSDELLGTYKAYTESLDDSLLKGLNPIQVFKMYYHAKNQGHQEVVYALYIKGDLAGTPDKETYFNDPAYAVTETMKQNAKGFYQKLTEVKMFEEMYMEQGECIIAFELGNRTDRPMFRMVKDQELEVWKVGWMPMN